MIRIGIMGYGNLGRGIECAIKQNDDLELVAVFTRRDPATVSILTEGAAVCNVKDVEDWKDKIDVLMLCGGSATDLPVQTPEYAKLFNVVDSFDTHARIPEHFANVDKAAKEYGHIGIISVGWDPGMFSLNRMYANAILPEGKDYTFWGKGVSQGHSDAIRRVEGVKDGKQYTIPVEAALEAVRNGEDPELTTRQKHTRECFVVLEEGADAAKVEETIKNMPNYFADYDTTVHFISEEELKKDVAAAEARIRKTDDFTSPEELYGELIASVKKYHPSDDISLIEKAYRVAADAHKDQKRKSGEPYIIHPLCVAIILADLELDKESIAAGLLHDVVEDTVMTEEELTEEFGPEVSLIVSGVTKLAQLKYSADKVEERCSLRWQRISALFW